MEKKYNLFKNSVGKTGQQHVKKMKLDHFHTPYTKVDSKWMKGLNARQETIKMPEENTGSNHFDLSCSNFFLNMSLEAKETKAKMNYRDLIKIKSFCIVNETINKTKRQTLGWEDICK